MGWAGWFMVAVMVSTGVGLLVVVMMVAPSGEFVDPLVIICKGGLQFGGAGRGGFPLANSPKWHAVRNFHQLLRRQESWVSRVATYLYVYVHAGV